MTTRCPGRLRRAGYYLSGLVVLVALLTIPVYLTGEPAEHELKHAAWLDRDLVHAHEEAAEAGLIGVLITGAAALGALWLAGGGRPDRRGVIVGVLAGVAVCGALFARAALAGGQIRHDEVRPAAAPAP